MKEPVSPIEEGLRDHHVETQRNRDTSRVPFGQLPQIRRQVASQSSHQRLQNQEIVPKQAKKKNQKNKYINI